MPKRIIDGEGIWRSDTLLRVEPRWMRAEYANLLPLALANGVFECARRRVWSQVYSYNRPEITIDDTEQILDTFARVGLLFRWQDEGGKWWGYWVGSDKPGRLPSIKRRQERHEKLGPYPPKDRLAEFLQAAENTVDANGNHSATNGMAGLGFGSGLGSGLGSGVGGGFSGKHLRLTAAQVAKLATTFPQTDLSKAFREMDAWLDATGKKRKNHYLFALNWLKSEKQPAMKSRKASSLRKAPRKPRGKALRV